MFRSSLESIIDEIVVNTDEVEQLELLSANVWKSRTVFNTVAPGIVLSGMHRDKEPGE